MNFQDICITKIRNFEWVQIVNEVSDNQLRIAFIPTLDACADREKLKKDIFEQFKSKACTYYGMSTQPLDGHDPSDAFVVRDSAGRMSVWVERNYPWPSYKEAYIQFWRQYGGLPTLAWIDGNKYNIDHSFNKARVVNERTEDQADPEQDKYAFGYIRLFLLTAAVNQSYGRGPERIVSAKCKIYGNFQLADWMVLLKLMQYEPVPETMLDAEEAAKHLAAAYGISCFSSQHDMALALAQPLGISASVGLVVSQDGKIEAVEVRQAIDRGGTYIKISETEFACILHLLTGWPMMEAWDTPTTTFWIGVKTPCNRYYGLLGYDIDGVAVRRGVKGDYSIRPARNLEVLGFDVLDYRLDLSAAWLEIISRCDEVCGTIQRLIGFKGRYCPGS